MFRCLCCFFRLWKAAGFEAFSFCQPWPSTSFQPQPQPFKLTWYCGKLTDHLEDGLQFRPCFAGSGPPEPENWNEGALTETILYMYIYITIPQWRFSERSQFVQRNRMHVQLIMKWLLYQLYQAIAGTRHPAAAHVYSYNHLHIRHNLYVYIYLSVCLSILLSICIYIYVYLSIDIL